MLAAAGGKGQQLAKKINKKNEDKNWL